MTYTEVGEWAGGTYPPGAVVVGYNARGHSEAPVAWAAAEAARQGAPMVVLFAANYPGMTVDPGPGLFHRDPQALEAAEEVTARGVAAALESAPDLDVVGATEVSSPSQALVTASDDAALVVLGSRSHGRIGAALLGSVAFAVASTARCPVVVVRDEDLEQPARSNGLVVVGSDGSSESAAAVRFAAQRAVRESAPLLILTCTGGNRFRPADEPECRSVARRIAESAATDARTAHPTLDVSVRVEDSPAEDTLVAVSADADLVVVGTRGRGAFEGLLLGSVSHAVIHGAKCAVAVVGEGMA